MRSVCSSWTLFPMRPQLSWRSWSGPSIIFSSAAAQEAAAEREAAAQVAKALADAVEARFAKRGKISGRSQMDINLFMIYYVFPAILLTQSECATLLADAIRDEWRGRFRNSEQLGYATYEEISGTFKEKFLGIF